MQEKWTVDWPTLSVYYRGAPYSNTLVVQTSRPVLLLTALRVFLYGKYKGIKGKNRNQ
jgi:hypothetical protein